MNKNIKPLGRNASRPLQRTTGPKSRRRGKALPKGKASGTTPSPGRKAAPPATSNVPPHVVVRKRAGQYVVLSNIALPTLGAPGEGAKARKPTEDELRRAQRSLRSAREREQTICQVTASIVKFQREFLDKGVNHLRALTRRAVAGDLGIHETTVGRATQGTFVQTPQGIYELAYFFNSAIESASGEDLASKAVKSKIKASIAREPPDAPLSDQEIADLLNKQGVHIARRTVAKYREALAIPSSSKRKRPA